MTMPDSFPVTQVVGADTVVIYDGQGRLLFTAPVFDLQPITYQWDGTDPVHIRAQVLAGGLVVYEFMWDTLNPGDSYTVNFRT